MSASSSTSTKISSSRPSDLMTRSSPPSTEISLISVRSTTTREARVSVRMICFRNTLWTFFCWCYIDCPVYVILISFYFFTLFRITMYRLNDYSRHFLSKGYLQEGMTAEDRIKDIAQTAEKILGKP